VTRGSSLTQAKGVEIKVKTQGHSYIHTQMDLQFAPTLNFFKILVGFEKACISPSAV